MKREKREREEEGGQESVVQIDENHLDRECIRLPSDYLQHAHAAAEAKRDVDELKAELEVAQAAASMDVRARPADYGIEKLTESTIKEVVSTMPKCLKIEKQLREARHHYELSQAVVWALETKKRTLTLLVELHGMGYFSAPKVSEKGRDAVEKMLQRRVRRADKD